MPFELRKEEIEEIAASIDRLHDLIDDLMNDMD